MGTGQMLLVVMSFVLFMTVAQNVNRARTESTQFVLQNQAMNDAIAYSQSLLEQAFPVAFDDLVNLNGQEITKDFGGSTLIAKIEVHYADPQDDDLIVTSKSDFRVVRIHVTDKDKYINITMDHIFAKIEGES